MNRCGVSVEQLARARSFGKQGQAPALVDMHRRVEGCVFAAAAAFSWHLVGELVVDRYLVAVGTLFQREGQRDGADLAVVDNARCNFGKGVADLIREDARVEFADEFGCVCGFHVLCLIECSCLPLDGRSHR